MPPLERYDDGFVRMDYRPGSFDREVIREVIEHDAYKMRRTRLPDDATVVDVGAHIGSFSAFTARLFPTARVFSCEMTPDNHALLARNTAGLRNVGTTRAAVIGARQPSGFVRRPGNSGGHYLVWGRKASESAGRTVTLADVLRETRGTRIDFLKLDCEGAEHEILRQAAVDGSLRAVRRTAGEYHNFHGEHGEELAELLRRNGFEVDLRVGDEHSGMFFAER